MATPQPDPRLEQLVELVVQLASGELSVRLPPSPAADDIDAVIVGINMLAEELEALNKHLEGRVAERTRQLADAHRQLERLALYDPLTGLPNRTLLAERIDEAVASTGAAVTCPRCSCSTSTGSRPSTTASATPSATSCWWRSPARLRAVSAAATPSPGSAATSSRWSSWTPPKGRSLDVADRILAALQRARARGPPDVLGQRQHRCALRRAGQTAGALLRDADTAMYGPRRTAGPAPVFDARDARRGAAQAPPADELRAALSGNEFVDRTTSRSSSWRPARAASVEALLRWRHPTAGCARRTRSSRWPRRPA